MSNFTEEIIIYFTNHCVSLRQTVSDNCGHKVKTESEETREEMILRFVAHWRYFALTLILTLRLRNVCYHKLLHTWMTVKDKFALENTNKIGFFVR